MQKTLLPTGCYDVLPPHARQESELSASLLQVFEGYEQVAPPMLEYSDSLLSARGAALGPQIFRVMDPSAHKVMGIRPDITLQVARIAASRLAHAPRPLRLCYNGVILRMQGEQLKSERQLLQAGIELIGAASPDADAEVILVAAEALKRAGITELSIDLNLPGIVGALLASEKLDNDQLQKLFEAVAHKDIAAINTISFAHRDTLIKLLECAGPAETALPAIQRLDLPESARQQCRDLLDVVGILGKHGCKEWALTVDATENRGLAYHSGISFSIFVPGAACEVGRGGRYRVESTSGDSEATGFTLYVETLRDLLPQPKRGKRVLIPEGVTHAQTAALREEGYITVHALSEYGQDAEEAKRLGCDFIFSGGKIHNLT
jgi:ATP phosphoribosyltransferase regulatory subunit